MGVRNDFEGVKKLAHPPISRELLEIICSDEEASKEQKRDIAKVSKNLGKRLYPEVLFSLTYIEIDNPAALYG